MNEANERSYQSYLLRIWRTGSYGERTWHCMLENPHTGQRHGFGDLDALCAFLQRDIGEVADTETGADGGQEKPN